MTFVLILLAALVALALVLSGPIVGALGSSLGISDTLLTMWRYAKWPAMLVLILLIFGALYYTAPNARVSGVRWVTAGSLLALALWIVASIALAVRNAIGVTLRSLPLTPARILNALQRQNATPTA